ncbi:hypothetical protein GOBAR_AA29818 [Gossypium barbadense]|uniref:Uncharacterized protein n=1 Tax=Gossypium barbadense TaxID=3634 RepID=A0A2P5WIH7_GOSBA|nr:hypothetical protein GOBAR_AA29818 [Gossypium barbadense]
MGLVVNWHWCICRSPPDLPIGTSVVHHLLQLLAFHAEPITRFFLSCGTLGGQPKLMPVATQVAKKWELFRGLYESPMIK